jgi:rod shape determining protein RodA
VSWIAFFVVAWIPYDRITKHADAIYAAGAFALVLVLMIGTVVNGSRRWFAIGTIRIQPSEFSKYCLVIFLARMIAREGERLRTWRGLVGPAVATLVPVALVGKQPDLGTALSHVPLLAAMLFAAGARLRHFAITGVGALAMLPVSWFFLLHDYQKQRVLTFLSPEKSASGGAYQQLQSQIAIGAGGLWGKGYEQGTQGQLGFLPFRHTDFIFAVCGEEWGLVGGLALLGLFGVLALGLAVVATRTRDLEGRLIVVGVASVLITHVLVNVGMATGMGPVTGIGLPFCSYGGSSLLANLLGLGLAASVARRKVVMWAPPRRSGSTTTASLLEDACVRA